MSGTNVSYAGVQVGDERTEEFPALTRTMFVRYAGASGDFNPMHHDDTIAAQVGNPSVGSSRVDLQACKLEYSIVSPK